MSTLYVADGAGFQPGDRFKLGGDPTPYVVKRVTGSQVTIVPVWWWRLWQAILSVFE